MMAGIYQEIWNADQSQNGIDAIWDNEQGNEKSGFVMVNSKLGSDTATPALRVLSSVHIPEHKKTTYDLVTKLFNNYSLPEPRPELETPQERQEVHNFVSAIVETAPMQVARDYIARQTGTTVSNKRWYNTIIEMWFRRFSSGGDPGLSGFEHVVVGEQEKGNIQGYHFWWKYYLDDGYADMIDNGITGFEGLTDDRITYHGSKNKVGQMSFPESVTISYKWTAPDYETKEIRSLFKKIGGFFVGCSVEGLIAMGTVRAHLGAKAPHVAIIEGARYDMKLYRSPNNQHIRTFYPIFQGPADNVDGGGREEGGTRPGAMASQLRIVAAMVNPAGADIGSERITLANVGAVDMPVKNWQLRDKNGKSHQLEAIVIGPGNFHQIVLPGRSAQLSNKGGNIELLDDQGDVVHQVSYSKIQARNQGVTILF